MLVFALGFIPEPTFCEFFLGLYASLFRACSFPVISVANTQTNQQLKTE